MGAALEFAKFLLPAFNNPKKESGNMIIRRIAAKGIAPQTHAGIRTFFLVLAFSLTVSLLTSLILSATLLFAGCAQYPDLTEEENEMVSEYAVSLLLKYDKDNHSRLVDTSEFLNKYNTALQERESARLAYEAAKQLEEKYPDKLIISIRFITLFFIDLSFLF